MMSLEKDYRQSLLCPHDEKVDSQTGDVRGDLLRILDVSGVSDMMVQPKKLT